MGWLEQRILWYKHNYLYAIVYLIIIFIVWQLFIALGIGSFQTTLNQEILEIGNTASSNVVNDQIGVIAALLDNITPRSIWLLLGTIVSVILSIALTYLLLIAYSQKYRKESILEFISWPKLAKTAALTGAIIVVARLAFLIIQLILLPKTVVGQLTWIVDWFFLLVLAFSIVYYFIGLGQLRGIKASSKTLISALVATTAILYIFDIALKFLYSALPGSYVDVIAQVMILILLVIIGIELSEK